MNDPRAMRIAQWVFAADPVFLAVVAYALDASGMAHPLRENPPALLAMLFAAAALGLVYVSFKLASGRYDPPLPAGAPPRPVVRGVSMRDGVRLGAVAIAAAPAVLGLVLHILTGDDWALLAFNGGALAVAVRHVMAFATAENNIC
jgi:hypothetical protein